jgi:hypothetical protein
METGGEGRSQRRGERQSHQGRDRGRRQWLEEIRMFTGTLRDGVHRTGACYLLRITRSACSSSREVEGNSFLPPGEFFAVDIEVGPRKGGSQT